jgi:hypothetical protein
MVVCRLWHVCQPRYPRFVDFSWSFPVNWYIQSILLYPAIKSVTFVSASLIHSHAQLQNCLPIPSLHTYQWHPNPITTFQSSLRLPFAISLRCCWSTQAVVGINSPQTRQDLYTPTLVIFSKSFISFLALRRTMYNPFMFSTLLFILHDPTVYRFSLPTRCGSSLITFIQPLHLDEGTTSLSRLCLNAYSFGPSLIGSPAVPGFLLASPIVLVFTLLSVPLSSFFLLLILLPAPFSHLLSIIHELVYEDNTAMRRPFFFLAWSESQF